MLALWACALAGQTCAPAAGSPAPGAHIEDYAAPGNLDSRSEPGCIAMGEARPQYNPVDLYKAVHACIAAKRFDDAVPLFMLAGVYGRFDSLRVADATAHQAVTVAKMDILGDVAPADNAAFGVAVRKRMDPAALPGLCADVRHVGPPDYVPRYMIQHGMGAFFGGGGDGLVPHFDRDAAWTAALVGYLHCPAA